MRPVILPAFILSGFSVVVVAGCLAAQAASTHTIIGKDCDETTKPPYDELESHSSFESAPNSVVVTLPKDVDVTVSFSHTGSNENRIRIREGDTLLASFNSAFPTKDSPNPMTIRAAPHTRRVVVSHSFKVGPPSTSLPWVEGRVKVKRGTHSIKIGGDDVQYNGDASLSPVWCSPEWMFDNDFNDAVVTLSWPDSAPLVTPEPNPSSTPPAIESFVCPPGLETCGEPPSCYDPATRCCCCPNGGEPKECYTRDNMGQNCYKACGG